MSEIWKDIEGYEGSYQVSNKGNVRSVDRIVIRSDGLVLPLKGKHLKKSVDSRGYPSVWLQTVGKKARSRRVHRLVAETFVNNPNNLREVNHKSGIKTDCSADNLEWCTRSHNMLHCWENGYREHMRRLLPNRNRKGGIVALNTENTTDSMYFMTSVESKSYGFNPRTIRNCAQNNKTYEGYSWYYVDDLKW